MAAVVLAAGRGTRMASSLPKVLHRVGGRPMVCRVVEASLGAGAEPVVVVLGWGAGRVRRAVEGEWGRRVRFALQGEQRGTGHALACGLLRLRGHRGTVLVLSGDVPLMRPETLLALLERHRRREAQASLLSVRLGRPRGYGRVVRGREGVREVVEEREATPAQRAIREVNAGVYAFEAAFLRRFLPRLRPQEEGGEILLPGLFALAREAGLPVAAFRSPRPEEALGVNNRAELAAADARARS